LQHFRKYFSLPKMWLVNRLPVTRLKTAGNFPELHKKFSFCITTEWLCRWVGNTQGSGGCRI